jgi:non-heme chloroperoxidase
VMNAGDLEGAKATLSCAVATRQSILGLTSVRSAACSVGGEAMTTVTKQDQGEVDKANTSGKKPVVFVHGLWLLPSSWDRWAKLCEGVGYAALPPGLAGRSGHDAKGEGTPGGHGQEVDRRGGRPLRRGHPGLKKKPAVVRHSFGGLMTEILAGRGLPKVSVDSRA